MLPQKVQEEVQLLDLKTFCRSLSLKEAFHPLLANFLSGFGRMIDLVWFYVKYHAFFVLPN
jgi:hypothetical protein